jgi:hypothetical protein
MLNVVGIMTGMEIPGLTPNASNQYHEASMGVVRNWTWILVVKIMRIISPTPDYHNLHQIEALRAVRTGLRFF